MKAALALAAALCVGCGPAGENEPPAPLQTAAAPAVPLPALPPRHFQIVISPNVSAEVENAALRAMTAWEQATVGYVTFTSANRTDPAPPCTDSVVWLDEATDVSGADDVAEHTFNGCHLIVMQNPWRDAEAFAGAYKRMGVSPFVAVLSHELGHALGLPHAASTAHSVMGPFIQLAIEPFPTCLDVNAFSLLRGQLIECYEGR